MNRRLTARKTTLDKLDDQFEKEFWLTITPDERFAETWRLSEEIWIFAGKDTDEPRLSRSIARVIRGAR